MTEREILKKLVACHDQRPSLGGFLKTIEEARKLLAETEPKPEHPAVVAYREWQKSDSYMGSDEIFLAGWKRALEHIADNFDDSAFMQCDVRRHLLAASNATPERLP